MEDAVDCLVCDRHSGAVDVPGGPIYEDDLVFVGHALFPEGSDRVYAGWLLIEPKRHVPGLADLRPEEAERVGALQSLVARALVEVVAAEHVYAFVLGHHVPHLHVHVLPRYRGTPREYWGTRVDEWPDAPTGDHAAIADLAERPLSGQSHASSW